MQPTIRNRSRLLAVQLNTSIGEPCRSGTILGNQGRYLEPSDPQCDAFAWLRNVLAAHRAKFGDEARVIIVQHYGYDGFGVGTDNYAYRGYWWAPDYRRQLAETIAPYRVIAFIHGHTHVPQFTTPGTKYSVPKFDFATAERNVDIELKRTPPPPTPEVQPPPAKPTVPPCATCKSAASSSASAWTGIGAAIT